jgi:hypothetical protein
MWINCGKVKLVYSKEEREKKNSEFRSRESENYLRTGSRGVLHTPSMIYINRRTGISPISELR